MYGQQQQQQQQQQQPMRMQAPYSQSMGGDQMRPPAGPIYNTGSQQVAVMTQVGAAGAQYPNQAAQGQPSAPLRSYLTGEAQGGPGGPAGSVTPSMQAMIQLQQKQNRIAPVAKPAGLDPVILLNERENR